MVPYKFSEAEARDIDVTGIDLPIGSHLFDSHRIDDATFEGVVQAVLDAGIRMDLSEMRGATIADFRESVLHRYCAPWLGAQILRRVQDHVAGLWDETEREAELCIRL